MKAIIFVLFSILVSVLACNFDNFIKQDPLQSESSLSVAEFIDYLQSIDNQKEINEDYQQYIDRIYKAINEPLNQTDSPAYLKSYFYACHQTKPVPIPTEFHDALSVKQEAKESILFRLASFRTEESAQTLVDIFADKNLHFDNQTALALHESMIQCGPVIIPYLQRVESIRPSTTKRIIECIHSGKSFF